MQFVLVLACACDSVRVTVCACDGVCMTVCVCHSLIVLEINYSNNINTNNSLLQFVIN